MPSPLSIVARHAPAVLTLLALGAVFWWGHRHGWRLAKPATPVAVVEQEDWCAEHHVAEAVCLNCRKSLGKAQIMQEPTHQRASGESVRFAQVGSAAVLSKAGITVATVALGQAAPLLRVDGDTGYAPGASARLGSRLDGVVRQILVTVGDQVPAGALLAVIDVPEVGLAKAALMQAVTARDLAQAAATRARATATAGVRSAADLDEIEARLRSADVAVIQAGQTLGNLGLETTPSTLSGLDVPTLVERLRHLGLPDRVDDGGSANLLPLRAPAAGTVTAIHAAAGEAVAAQAPLLTVADARRLWAKLPLPAEHARQVTVGQAVTFHVAGTPAAAGTVAAIAQEADPQTRLVTVWAHLANDDQRLRVGVFGSATITTGPAVPAAWLPAEAVQYDGDQAVVFVRRSDTIFRCLAVTVLDRRAGQLAVDRLLAGDVVATSGTGQLFASAFIDRLGAGCCAPE